MKLLAMEILCDLILLAISYRGDLASSVPLDEWVNIRAADNRLAKNYLYLRVEPPRLLARALASGLRPPTASENA